jgi:DNA-binding PadR family transcriptional regulator
MDYRARMAHDPTGVDALLPLQQAEFHILLALSADDRHGYGIIQDVDARTNGALRLSAGTLYRTIQRLLEQGLIEEPRKPAARGKDDPRRRYYRITPLGTAVARAETQRLADLVRLARHVWRVAESS